jgi:hypothetical protein
MIDLGVPARLVDGVTLYADHANPLHLHALPGAPRIARAADGTPAVSLLRLVRDGALSRALFEVTAELGFAEGALEAIADRLREELDEEGLTVGPAVVRSAAAELFFVTRQDDSADARALHHGLAEVPAHFAAPHRARVLAELSPEGARLMEAAIRTGGAPVGLRYRLEIEALRPSRRVMARIDWSRVYEHVSSHWRAGVFFSVSEVRRLTERLIEDRAIEIVAVEGLRADAGEDADGEAERSVAQVVAWIQRELVERFAKPVLELSREPATVTLGTAGEILGAGRAYEAKAITQVEHSVATVDFQRPDTVVRTVVVQAHLADALGGGDARGHIADVQPGSAFFERTRFTVSTTRPLAQSFVKEVVAQWRWGADEHALRLVPEQPTDTAEDWTDASPQGTWEVALTVSMADDAPVSPGEAVRLEPIAGSGRTLVLDLEQLLGLRSLTLLAPAGVEGLLGIRCQVEHLRAGEVVEAREVVATPSAPEHQLWFAGWSAGDTMRVRPSWMLLPMRVFDGAPIPVETEVMPLPPPVTWRTVQVVSEADWGGLRMVGVELAPREGEAVATLSFDGPNQLQAVRLEVPDPDERRYRYRTTKTLESGAVETSEWLEADVAVLFVGQHSAFERRLELLLVGPELPQAGVRLVEVDLEYLDPPNQVRHTEKAVLEAVNQRFTWSVPIADPTVRTVVYVVTLHMMDGRTVRRPRTPTDERLVPIPILT